MPQLANRKRRSDRMASEDSDTSSEPATQRRRNSPAAGEDGDHSEIGAAAEDSNLDQMTKKLVRMALACEYQRKPIRRADISEKVLGSAGRRFKEVFQKAQLELRNVFGMEMVELPVREKVTAQQRRAALSQSQANKTSASWIVASILPTSFHNPEILPPPAAPTSGAEAQYTAIYTLLISLVSLSGGSLPEAKLERSLRRLGMEDNTPVEGYEKTEKLLKRIEREGYLVKIKESAGPGNEEDVFWMVGPRGKVEVGDSGVEGLTREVYGSPEGQESQELGRRIARSLGLGEQNMDRARSEAPKKARRKSKNNQTQEADTEVDEDGEESD